MNNLKRVLSLGLTGAMLTGMMVMGASAAKFNDADKITHTEAVNTMVALGVLKGKDTGNYDPQGIVTRAEMAKIICVSLNGGEDPTLGVKATPTYKDIKGHWAESYIEYCSSIGVIAGQGDGTFAPDATVTGSAAAKMFLVALGYDSDVFGFTGMDWEINTNVQANDAKLYDDLKGMNASAGLSRDNAAQMAFNAMEAKIMDKTYDKVLSNGEISYNYNLNEKTTFLNKYFDAYTFIGTYEGNKDTGAANVDGQIKVVGRLDTVSAEYKDGKINNNRPAYFPSDLDISNIGEEVKVIFKDGKSGTTEVPDKNDTIYGVFNTGKTEVYNVTKNDIQDAKSETQVKFGDTKYDLASSVKVVTNYITGEGKSYNYTEKDNKQGSELQKNLKAQSVDTIKFVCDDNGKISAAYVVEYKAAKVTSASSSKISLTGVGSIDRDGNDIYEGIAKDDVVFYTAFYKDGKDLTDATFTVSKAETVKGELKGYKNSEKVTVDDATYKINNEKLATNLTDDAVATSELSGKLNEDVTLYLVGGMVVAIDAADTTTNSYALVTGSNKGDLDADYDALNVKVRLADGTTAKYDVHKDTEKEVATALKGMSTPVLVKYTMSGDKIKVKEIVAEDTKNLPTLEKVWNKTTKALNYSGEKTLVATTDAVLFVKVDTDYYTYNLRSLGNIAKTRLVEKTGVSYFEKDGQVVAAYMQLTGKPGSNTTTTLYGIITGSNGVRKDDDTTYASYSVWTGEDTNILVEEDKASLAVGSIITFDQTTDGKYSTGDIKAVSTYDKDAKSYTLASGYNAVAVDSYNASKAILTYFEATKENENKTFVGVDPKASVTVADDVTIVYVDADEQDEGGDNGVDAFDSTTGNLNAIIHLNDDKVVDTIIVETSGKLSLGK